MLQDSPVLITPRLRVILTIHEDSSYHKQVTNGSLHDRLLGHVLSHCLEHGLLVLLAPNKISGQALFTLKIYYASSPESSFLSPLVGRGE